MTTTIANIAARDESTWTPIERALMHAYWCGEADAARRVCDKAATVFRAQIDRVRGKRYWRQAHEVQGGVETIYDADYGSDFGSGWEIDIAFDL